MGSLLDKPQKEKVTEVDSGMGFNVAVSGMQGWRKSMEDSHIVNIDNNVAVFGVYDGHGGREAADFVERELVGVFNKQSKARGMGEAIKETYHELDRMMMLNSARYSQQGCTAVTAVIQKTGPNDKGTCWFANCGDSRAIIGTKNGKVRECTHDHKPNSPTERTRIEAAGGTVDAVQGQYRVCGNLNLSRALGDLRYKQATQRPPDQQIISGSPDITEVALEADDEFLILCCDGIWDVLTNEECLEFVQNYCGDDHSLPKLKSCVEALLERACSPDAMTHVMGTDNMTACIVALNAGGSQKPVLKFELDDNIAYKDVEIYVQKTGEVFDSVNTDIEEEENSEFMSDLFRYSSGAKLVLRIAGEKKFHTILPDDPNRIIYDKRYHQVLVY